MARQPTRIIVVDDDTPTVLLTSHAAKSLLANPSLLENQKPRNGKLIPDKDNTDRLVTDKLVTDSPSTPSSNEAAPTIIDRIDFQQRRNSTMTTSKRRPTLVMLKAAHSSVLRKSTSNRRSSASTTTTTKNNTNDEDEDLLKMSSPFNNSDPTPRRPPFAQSRQLSIDLRPSLTSTTTEAVPDFSALRKASSPRRPSSENLDPVPEAPQLESGAADPSSRDGDAEENNNNNHVDHACSESKYADAEENNNNNHVDGHACSESEDAGAFATEAATAMALVPLDVSPGEEAQIPAERGSKVDVGRTLQILYDLSIAILIGVVGGVVGMLLQGMMNQ